MVKVSAEKQASPKKFTTKKVVPKGDTPNSKEARTLSKLVEATGQKLDSSDKRKLRTIIGRLKRRRPSTYDLQKLVTKISAFENEGILELQRFKDFKCCICQKLGHPREVCPKGFRDGKWHPLCYVCGEIGHPHPACQERNVCILCKEEGHICKECPEFLSKKNNNAKQTKDKTKDKKKNKKELVEKKVVEEDDESEEEEDESMEEEDESGEEEDESEEEME